ncbi:MAG: nitroreductase family protein [Actinomycetota bacterium]|nr:nitroreductase family protein [Actinomycetota bacterium]
MNDEFFGVVTRQRACRSFSTEGVDDDAIGLLLTAATFAPSAENKQPWEFVVVRDDATRTAIGDLSRRAWEAGGRAFSEGRLTPEMLADVDRGATGGVARAPVNIVVCADVQRGLEATIPSSIFPAVQNLLLTATALGFGSALTTITAGFRSEMQAILGLPEHVRPIALVPIGHPARPLGPPRRAPFTEHTHRERYGNAW